MSAEQDYTSFTEVDTPTKLTVAATLLTVAGLDSDEEVYLTYDFTADYFSADVAARIKFNISATTGSEIVYLWALANSVDEIGALITADNDLLCLSWENGKLVLTERNGAVSTLDTSTTTFSENTDYWARIIRDEDTGTHGTLYAYIYTDPQYINHVETLVVTLTEKKDLRYLYAVSGKGDGAGGVSISLTIEDLIIEDVPYTLGDIRTRVRDLLNDENNTTTPYFCSDAQLNRWANDGQRDIASKALCLNNIDSLTTTASTRIVSFNGHRVVFLEYLVSSTDGIGLRRILPLHAGRQREEGDAPQKWFESGAHVCMEPILAAESNLKAYIADYPSSEMSANADLPEIPPEYRPLIVLYVLSKALKKEKRHSQSFQIKSMYDNELLHTRLDKNEIIPDSYEDIENGR